ncbi:hypothetical protein FE257_008191 [Aspergillus nanangensis]|uniref:Alpha-acetolactate decarboxylase n=1 Tax=Aspergillus nanangensis TaxID=2582783 RepID=A0AAD4GTL5_ASPNN|nr:hypothetical protein FE257_008191 [Aspergillus nanangensis]
MSNQIYQYSILGALMHGICHDGTPVQQILRHGDHGIGTIRGMDGEVIIVDGEAYHFPPDGPLREIEDTDTIPFIMMTQFKPTLSKSVSSLSMGTGLSPSLPLLDALSPLLPAQQNRFLSIRIDANFLYIKFRVIPAQTKSRESLADLAKRQAIKERSDLPGVLFGFWSPAHSSGFSVAGFHLHFISSDRTCGGHVMGFEARDVQLRAAGIGNYHVELPASAEFNDVCMGRAMEKDLHAAEGNPGC